MLAKVWRVHVGVCQLRCGGCGCASCVEGGGVPAKVWRVWVCQLRCGGCGCAS